MSKANDKQNTGAGDSHAFQADTAKLLHLLIHSVYSDKDIFLRELVSNAADACDKLRYQAIAKPELLADDPDFRITVTLDAANKLISVADNGVGMGKTDLIANLGTIARSGTRAFVDKLKDAKDGTGLIGQFGVGFYSAFMVAHTIEVFSAAAGSKPVWCWRSEGAESFSISSVKKSDDHWRPRGTEVLLHISDDGKDYLDAFRLRGILQTYSSHIPFPVFIVEVKDGEQGEPEQIGDATAIWMRPKSKVKEAEYKEFYGQVSGQFEDPLATIHYRAEGRQEYSVLAFLPTSQPFDLFDPARKSRMKLYVRRVFITEEADILPPYLRFVRGIIDSEDLPLNISREMLQENPLLKAIGTGVAKRVLSEIRKIADKDPEKYETFWTAFGAVLKEGLYEDPAKRDDLFELARFRTSSSGEAWRSLKEYVADMKDNQTAIYYMTGTDAGRLASSPQLEGYRARGIEVLLLSDPVDSFWVATALGFDGKPFKSVTQGAADLDEIEVADKDDKSEKPSAPGLAKLLTKFKEILGDTVAEVAESNRLTDSVSCLVAPMDGPDRSLEKILARQSGEDTSTAPILEINPTHPLIRDLAEKAEQSDGVGAYLMEDMAWLLFDQARIADGEAPYDPAEFSRRFSRRIAENL
jgi:molecular chaperone HtpG